MGRPLGESQREPSNGVGHDPRPQITRDLEVSASATIVYGTTGDAHGRSWTRRVGTCLFVVLLALLGLTGPAAADVGDLGVAGASFAGTSAPTGSKPESKAWWNDGYWWATMFDATTKDFYIFKLDPATQTWLKTSSLLDKRANSRADTLWDGTHLYVASHVYSNNPASGYPSLLYRFSYDASNDAYTLDPGFPVQINDLKTETLVLAKDSEGKIWATWVYAGKVYANRTESSDAEWGNPFVLGAAGAANVSADDVSSAITFDNKVGIMWSNQVDNAFYFAIHVTGSARNSWSSTEVLQGPKIADDHINLKADATGTVYAVVKTGATASSAPSALLLTRNATTGAWTQTVVGLVADALTRPILLLDEDHDRLHVFASAPCCSGGTIYEKSSPTDLLSFPAGRGTPFIHDADSPALNDPTSTKQNVTSSTGLLVLASNDVTDRYWHAYESLADPSAEITSGPSGAVSNDEASFEFVSNPPDADFTCSLDGGAFTSCTSPTTYTGLAEGAHIFAVSADGGAAATRTWIVDTTAPTLLGISTPGLKSGFRFGQKIKVMWSSNDAGSGPEVYDVRYRKTRWNGESGPLVTWKSGTAMNSGSVPARKGDTNCFSFRARDSAGNWSDWSNDACTAVPLDDRALSPSGSWQRGSGPGFYRSTFSTSFIRSSALYIGGVKAKKLALVATRCRGCGSIKVYWRGELLKRIDLSASKTRKKQVISIRTFASAAKGKVRIVVASDGRKVSVDGLAIATA
jgi:hypothetical protein